MAHHCPHCGIEYGMAPGTGDCGCEEDFDVGFPLPTVEETIAAAEATNRWAANYFGQPRKKVVIEMEGPGLDGLHTAMSFLELSGYLTNGEQSGSFEDDILQVKGTWKITN